MTSDRAEQQDQELRPDRRDRLAFDRWDHWGLQAILWIVAVVAAVSGAIIPVVDWLAARPITASVHAQVSVAGLADRASVVNPASVDVVIDDPTMAERLVTAAPGVLTGAAVLWVVWLLLRLVGGLRSGDPFTTENVRRLDTIALVIGIGAAVVALVGMVRDVAVSGAVLPAGTDQVFVLPTPVIPWLTAMLVVAAIAQAFRHGVRLREDVDGLV